MSFRAKKNLKVIGLEVGNSFGSIRLATAKTPQARLGLGKIIKREVCEAVNHGKIMVHADKKRKSHRK